MGIAGNLRRRLLQRRLARREGGPELLALVAGEAVVSPPAARSTLAEYIARGAWLQGEVARRIEALFAAGHEAAGDFLLAAALEGAPASHLFVGARLSRLAALGRRDEALAYARELMERDETGLEILQRLIAGLRRAGISENDPLLGEAWRRWRELPAGAVERGLGEGRLYRALGMTGAARWRLRAARDAATHGRDRMAVEQALADLADARDRWLEAPPAGRRNAVEARAGLAERFGRSPLVSDTGPLVPADLAGEPLANAFDWLLDGETGDHAEYRPRDRLLLVGNTLGCGGMERILAQTYRHFADSDAFADVDLALIGFDSGGEDGFYAALAGVGEGDIVLLDRSRAPDFPFTLLPGSWKARC